MANPILDATRPEQAGPGACPTRKKGAPQAPANVGVASGMIPWSTQTWQALQATWRECSSARPSIPRETNRQGARGNSARLAPAVRKRGSYSARLAPAERNTNLQRHPPPPLREKPGRPPESRQHALTMPVPSSQQVLDLRPPTQDPDLG